ncbi:hypothetical protein DCCM_0228 [Desulfocucumis palustris]|uniref:Uncharacterized protein n=1 Tax=Desulfocucumis palustris TaxID=1898651 RepID=A0A2L2X779_9FIRM|nr:hypothetical protein [Desulfocucumis palustris]GBF32037.1 hypothetical protein DCCM_0228 [Desulfocucumis palustris]
MKLYLGRLELGSIQNNAGVFYGRNSLQGWQTRSKGNATLGRVNGDSNYIASRLNFLHDQDVFDMFVNQRPAD